MKTHVEFCRKSLCGFTFRSFICFLKSSENSFFLFAPSSSPLPPSSSSYLQGDTSTWRSSSRDSCDLDRSRPAFQSRSPSFLLRRGSAGSRRRLWVRCSGPPRSWCWVRPLSPAAPAPSWGYGKSRRLLRSLASCSQKTWRWRHGDNWWEGKNTHSTKSLDPWIIRAFVIRSLQLKIGIKNKKLRQKLHKSLQWF